ncbi:hypothetical protein GAPWK_1887 [Gilliamella apicola]|nr:hypothetical protein GAPWK_1887 [Gilliamella apicola]
MPKKLRAFCIGIEISLTFCWQNMTKVTIANKPIIIKTNLYLNTVSLV